MMVEFPFIFIPLFDIGNNWLWISISENQGKNNKVRRAK